MSFVLVVRMKAKEGKEAARGRGRPRARRGLARTSRAARPTSRAATRRMRGSFLFYEQYRRQGGLRGARRDASTSSGSRLGELFALMESRERTFYETL